MLGLLAIHRPTPSGFVQALACRYRHYRLALEDLRDDVGRGVQMDLHEVRAQEGLLVVAADAWRDGDLDVTAGKSREVEGLRGHLSLRILASVAIILIDRETARCTVGSAARVGIENEEVDALSLTDVLHERPHRNDGSCPHENRKDIQSCFVVPQHFRSLEVAASVVVDPLAAGEDDALADGARLEDGSHEEAGAGHELVVQVLRVRPFPRFLRELQSHGPHWWNTILVGLKGEAVEVRCELRSELQGLSIVARVGFSICPRLLVRFSPA
mmetsp:Transcript_69385/g.144900  ORF Transcript_69385/g.144900 Transcript_69385/m.144900 type:complete len:271 (+) Transcript_69385:193-1005(+)